MYKYGFSCITSYFHVIPAFTHTFSIYASLGGSIAVCTQDLHYLLFAKRVNPLLSADVIVCRAFPPLSLFWVRSFQSTFLHCWLENVVNKSPTTSMEPSKHWKKAISLLLILARIFIYYKPACDPIHLLDNHRSLSVHCMEFVPSHFTNDNKILSSILLKL